MKIEHILLIIAIVVLIIFIFVLILRSSKFKKKMFNKQVDKALRPFESKYEIYRNCEIPYSKRITTIPYILLGNGEIYIINNIYMDGTITGKEKDSYFVSKIKKHKKILVKEFENPIHSLIYKESIVKEYLDFKGNIESIIVFNNSAKLNIHISKDSHIVNVSKLKKLLAKLLKHNNLNLNCFEKDNIKRLLYDSEKK